MKNFNNKVAVITGAGSGIGRALAIQLSTQGCHLALADINRAGLDETKTLLRSDVTVSCTVSMSPIGRLCSFSPAMWLANTGRLIY